MASGLQRYDARYNQRTIHARCSRRINTSGRVLEHPRNAIGLSVLWMSATTNEPCMNVIQDLQHEREVLQAPTQRDWSARTIGLQCYDARWYLNRHLHLGGPNPNHPMLDLMPVTALIDTTRRPHRLTRVSTTASNDVRLLAWVVHSSYWVRVSSQLHLLTRKVVDEQFDSRASIVGCRSSLVFQLSSA
jgi:hypothetical protein